MNSNEMVKTAVKALDDKKANNIRIINIKEVSSMGDYLVVADGSNRNQVQAMCDNVEEFMHKAGFKLKNREGYANGGWILLDYYDIIVHIFAEEERSFYDLEHIWRDGNIVEAEDL
ncbi:MAG: ribosome silencing factor [Lachnospiraceae bacterium]|nr:ribosome silencing factor [Lachnospiraceae bacterium]